MQYTLGRSEWRLLIRGRESEHLNDNNIILWIVSIATINNIRLGLSVNLMEWKNFRPKAKQIFYPYMNAWESSELNAYLQNYGLFSKHRWSMLSTSKHKETQKSYYKASNTNFDGQHYILNKQINQPKQSSIHAVKIQCLSIWEYSPIYLKGPNKFLNCCIMVFITRASAYMINWFQGLKFSCEITRLKS